MEPKTFANSHLKRMKKDGFSTIPKWNVEVKFELSFNDSMVTNSSTTPYVGTKDFQVTEVLGEEEMKEKLEDTLRKYFAGLNEFQVEWVNVVVKGMQIKEI